VQDFTCFCDSKKQNRLALRPHVSHTSSRYLSVQWIRPNKHTAASMYFPVIIYFPDKKMPLQTYVKDFDIANVVKIKMKKVNRQVKIYVIMTVPLPLFISEALVIITCLTPTSTA
jgi:hypothetical protein